jgi:glucose/arabinose dehydrogenase
MTKNSGIGLLALAVLAAGAFALSAAAADQAPAPKDELAQNFAAEHETGRRFQFDAANLPAPKTPPVVTNRSLIVPFGGQTLEVPPGFTATPFATGLANPRRLLVLPNGDVLVAEPDDNCVRHPQRDGASLPSGDRRAVGGGHLLRG